MEPDPLQILNSHVYRTWDTGSHDESWRNLPEIPTIAEIMPKEEDGDQRREEENWNDYQNDPIYDPKLPKNIIEGPWPSKEHYISAHYQILREDSVAPLREAIKYFKQNRNMNDDNSTCIYTHVHFKGLNLSPFGAAFKIEFSTERAGKQIRWEQSKRLMQGTMVALSPASDMFEKVCKIAIVAARPIIHGLDQNPPRIDLFWGDPTDVAFDPVESYIMIEARQGYLEAYRHVLVGLQKLRTERFTLASNIVHLDPEIRPPAYLKQHSILDLRSLVLAESNDWSSTTADEDNLQNVDVLQGIPAVPKSGMDASQISALERMITKRVAIIQGPPGTGKTFTSVSSLKVLLSNLQPGDPPVVIAAQTNHALDQLIKHVQVSEENIVRLGSRCDKENVDIIKRTLYELRKSTKDAPRSSRDLKVRKLQLDNHIDKIQLLMSPLLTASALTDEILLRHGLITEEQQESLYELGWYEGNQSQRDGKTNSTSISAWLGEGSLIPIPQTPRINLGLPLEEADLEFEQLQELEHELEGVEFQEDKDRDTLWGKSLPFLRQFTGKATTAIDDRKIKKVLGSHDCLYDIPEAWRGSVYRYWEKQINRACLAQLKVLLVEYKRIIDDMKVTKWNSNIKLIRHLGTKLIGCTTTGISKYRPLLAALQPRTLLIEEAAETLEGSVMAGMFDSLEHLILVGDHKQLQAHCSVKALEGAPYHMGMSLFERLISNSMGFTMLNVQRRMIPDIRELLCIAPEPFYPDLHDHPSVEDRLINRPPVPGMGGMDSYFFHHTWPETRGTDLSRHNQDEAEMIVGFFQYLVFNGIKHSQITVLTFYNGQRKTILRELKKHPGLRGNTYFNVFTVDSYQGEENDIILLSLVRSNEALGIGFLESRNRLVVALSRARRGLYIFGNAITLTAAETSEIGIGRDVLWTPVINFMKSQGQFHLDYGLPIVCSNHSRTHLIMEADEWLGLAGGCGEGCSGILPCGHNCPLKCHPFDHEMVLCRIACPKVLSCGHGCSHFCGDVCECSHCEKIPEEITSGGHIAPITRLTELDSQETSNDAPPSRYFPGSTPLRMKCGFGQPSDFGRPNQWQSWDAQKADAEMAEMARQKDAEKSSIDYSKIMYKDTWRAVSLQNGERAVSGPERKFIHRACIEDQSPTGEASAAPKIQSRAMDKKDANCGMLSARSDQELLEYLRYLDLSSTSVRKARKANSQLELKTGGASSPLDPLSRPPSTDLWEPCDTDYYPQFKGPLPTRRPPPVAALETAPKVAMDESEDLIDLGDDATFSPAIVSDTLKTTASASTGDGTSSGDSTEYRSSKSTTKPKL